MVAGAVVAPIGQVTAWGGCWLVAYLVAGGLTNLGVEISFFDEQVDFAIAAKNHLGTPFVTFIDTIGFPCEAPPHNRGSSRFTPTETFARVREEAVGGVRKPPTRGPWTSTRR